VAAVHPGTNSVEVMLVDGAGRPGERAVFSFEGE